GGGFDNSQLNNTSLTSSHLNNNLSFTKKTFLSLATISFLATCANASIVTISDQVSNGTIEISKAKDPKVFKEKQIKNSKSISGGGCNNGTICTINNSQTNGVTIGNNGTLIIEKEGSVIVSNNPSVDISSDSKNIEIINKGSISGPDRAGIRINGNNNQLTQINNSGEINGGHGITFNGSNNTLDNLTNSGVIQGTNSGINIQGSNNTIKSIINNGTITGGSNGISVS
ncbi:hypothetical protein KJQ78_09335, partial [Campylobacter lari]|nr:hypothetical protein [Campylobacter lari]